MFWIDPGWSFRLYPGIYIVHPKQGSTSKCLEQIAKSPTSIAHFPLVRDYCAKRLRYWDQQYYCNHAQHIFFPAFFNSTFTYYWLKKGQETCDLVDLVYDAKVFVTSMTSLGPCLLLRGRNIADQWRTQNYEKYREKKRTSSARVEKQLGLVSNRYINFRKLT